MRLEFNKRLPSTLNELSIDSLALAMMYKTADYHCSYSEWKSGKFIKFSWIEDSLDANTK